MFEQFIRRQRSKRDMSQAQLAEELGISLPTYGRIERGERELSISEARRLAAAFDMPFEDFLDQREPQRRVTLPRRAASKPAKLQIRVTRKNLQKFQNVLLYVLSKVGGKPNVGETVLHKLLYFIDFDYYERYEESLTGATYIRNHHGPTAVELGRILEKLQEQGHVKAVKVPYYGRPQRKYLSCVRPDLEGFSAREVTHIDEVLNRLSDKNAREIEQYSREDLPWQVAQDGRPIDYESVFYRDEKYSVRSYDDEL